MLGAEGAKENFYKALKLIYTVILWYRFVVRPPPPPRGEPSFCDCPPPPPPRGGHRPDKRGEISRGAEGSSVDRREFGDWRPDNPMGLRVRQRIYACDLTSCPKTTKKGFELRPCLSPARHNSLLQTREGGIVASKLRKNCA